MGGPESCGVLLRSADSFFSCLYRGHADLSVRCVVGYISVPPRALVYRNNE